MKELFPGVFVASAIGILSHILAAYIPNLGEVTLAIVLGITIGNLCKLPETSSKGIEFCEKKLLSYAVILMGFGLNFFTLKDLGVSSVVFIFLLIITTISIGWIMARSFGLTHSLGTLLGMGNAICGASAIAATSPFITKNKDEVGISIGVVNLIGTVGIFLLPLVSHLLQFNQHQASILIGGSLQAVGHVIAAGYTVSDQVGEMATAVKMARVFLLGPTLMILVYISKRQPAKANKSNFLALPFYLYGFILCAFINNLGILPLAITAIFQKISHLFLIVAMAGVGLRIRLTSLLRQGPRALAFGTFIFSIQLTVLALGIILLR